MLAVEHRRAIARDELADELWPEQPPRSWETALRAVVSKLRTALSASGVAADNLIANAFGCCICRGRVGSTSTLRVTPCTTPKPS